MKKVAASSHEEAEGEVAKQPGKGSSNTTTTTVYFLINNDDEFGTISNSFYAIDIPNPPFPPPPLPSHTTKKGRVIQINPIPQDEPLSPILTFDAMTYPHGMRCVKFCSKFYFLGGQYIAADGEEAPLHDIFPPNVYIYDPILQSLQPGVPMTTGKPNPLLFVVDHKLYVLGSLPIHDHDHFSHRPIPLSRVDELDSGIKHFEVFDISTGRWTALKDPPKLDLFHRWTRCAVVKRKVFILGSPSRSLGPLSRSPQLVLFNLDTQEWTKLSLPEPILPVVKFTSSLELLGGDTYTFLWSGKF